MSVCYDHLTMKKIVPFILLIGLFLVPSKPALACDPTGCLMGGHKQDVLALVTVTATNGEIATVTVDHYYDASKLKSSETLQIDFTNGTPWYPLTPEVGKHYFVSLECPTSICLPKWGTWEVDSSDFRQAKLLAVRWGDDAAIQWFMNEKPGSFYGIGENMYVRTTSGDYEIYPDYIVVPASVTDNIEDANPTTQPSTPTATAAIAIAVIALGAIIWISNKKTQK